MTNQIHKAVQVLREGGLVAFPTETVYGLGADAKNPEAVARVFKAKGRPADHPLIVHIASSEALSDWAAVVTPAALKLALAFWPGPLTLVLKKAAHVSYAVTGGQETVALRVPQHEVTLRLLEAFQGGLVAPSANQFTRLSPTTAEAVIAELGGRVDLVLDGGRCTLGIESTIIDMSGDAPVLLRHGMLPLAQIEAVLGCAVSLQSTQRAPGQHPLHYSPRTKCLLATVEEIELLMQEPLRRAVLAHSPLQERPGVDIIPMPSSPDAYAHELYFQLRRADEKNYEQIVIERVPEDAAWLAISDRLVKACWTSHAPSSPRRHTTIRHPRSPFPSSSRK